MPRRWGRWTEIKLDAIEDYIRAFTTAAQRAPLTLYLDLFGGRPENLARDEVTLFRGSALRAALVTPPFSQLIVSELDQAAAREQERVLAELAGERVQVVQGDCNVVMPEAMDALPRGFRFAPAFALVDQYSAEVKWSTLRYLAAYKGPNPRTKIELMMYFGGSFMVRGLRGPNGRVNPSYAQRLDALYGNERWRMVLAAGDDHVLTPSQVQHELVNTMRWQLEEDLGYATTLPLSIVNTRGIQIFSMLFATDHPVGVKIMSHLFAGADEALEQMVRQSKIDAKVAHEVAEGRDALFDIDSDMWHAEGSVAARPPIGPPAEPFEYRRYWDLDLRQH